MQRLAQICLLALLSLVTVTLWAQPPDSGAGKNGERGPGRALGSRGGQLPLPDTIRVEKDIPYAGTNNPAQTLDLLLPKSPTDDKPLPVVVNIHGGAFKMGDKSMGVGEIAPLVASGDFAAVTINYRLSGEAIWPAQMHDCKAAIRWVRASAAQYHLDAERIGAIGASAGGHLAAMLGTSAGVESLEGDIGPHKGTDSRVQCVVDEFGPTDFLAMGGSHDDEHSPEAELIGGALQDHPDLAKAASPITYVSRNAPPFLIIHGDKDPLVPFSQSEILYAALKKANVECIFVRIQGAGHGGFRNPEVAKRIRQFLDKYLRQEKLEISDAPVSNTVP